MNKIKPTSYSKSKTYVINIDEYMTLAKQLNERKENIVKISPVFVANQISDRLVINTMYDREWSNNGTATTCL